MNSSLASCYCCCWRQSSGINGGFSVGEMLYEVEEQCLCVWGAASFFLFFFCYFVLLLFFKPTKMMQQFHHFSDISEEEREKRKKKSSPFCSKVCFYFFLFFANQLGRRVMSAVDNDNDNKLGFF